MLLYCGMIHDLKLLHDSSSPIFFLFAQLAQWLGEETGNHPAMDRSLAGVWERELCDSLFILPNL